MSFEKFFAFRDADSFEDKIIKFIVGVSPSMQQMHCLVERTGVNIFKKKVPSTAIGIELAAGVACANALKLMLGRGDTVVAPTGLHFDAYRNRLIKTWRPWGQRQPEAKTDVLVHPASASGACSRRCPSAHGVKTRPLRLPDSSGGSCGKAKNQAECTRSKGRHGTVQAGRRASG